MVSVLFPSKSPSSSNIAVDGEIIFFNIHEEYSLAFILNILLISSSSALLT